MKSTLRKFALLNFMMLAISSNAMAALSCADLFTNGGKQLLRTIRTEVQQTDGKTVGALDALRSIDLPPATMKPKIEAALAKDAYLKERLSTEDRSKLADALVEPQNRRRNSLNVIRRFLFLKDRPVVQEKPQDVSVDIAKTPAAREQIKSEIISEAKRYLDAEWSHFSDSQRQSILSFLETSVFPDPLFQKDPASYLSKWQENRGGLEMLITPNDQAQSFLEYLLERNELRGFATKVASAGIQSSDQSALLSSKWSKPTVVSPAKPVVAPAPVNGIVETRISSNQLRMKGFEQSADKLILQLDQGGSGWKPLTPSLVEKITTAAKEYNHTNFDVMTPQRIAAIDKIQTALRESFEFGTLDSRSIEDLARALASGNRNLRTPMFGTKHMLYHSLVEMGVNRSQALTDVLISLQGLGKQSKQVAEETWTLDSMLNSGLKGISGIRELEARFQKIQAEVNSGSKIPDDVVNSLVTIAQEYNASNMGGFDVLTPGHHRAMEKYQKLITEHPFFANVDKRQIEQLQWNWQRATTAQNAINILSPLVGNQSVDAKRQELRTLAQAIQLFRGY
ncbi:MAG: hypothetical protein ACK5RO_04715 [Pseudobdellovibrionaceae bacterium]